MASQRRSSSALTLLCLTLLGAAAWSSLGFVAPSAAASARPRVARAAFESGKVNAGVAIGQEVAAPPQPVMDCDAECMTAIFDCVDDGCSVEALWQLDAKLAEDEAIVDRTIQDLSAQQKLNYSTESADTVAWLSNFLDRSGSLRAQLQSLVSIAGEDNDFVKKMVKAAAVAFGGGRKGDYPKVGVSSYSA
eukprot:CAMPEP_0195069458 /NCGR_PEP_ID=MMETSP0448-20130528/13758_1 /TAXON_ID=66468 /ORGANISM="Heterocapsa triquestra, Strain CCMP 448" /LENGTH=190 /DNA_ID=CAMNT_0040101065 /DNA_START=49 /DNA_END=621 /DNA_ORIENTATION=+